MGLLRENDFLKLELIKLVKEDGLSVAAAANLMGVGVRSAQEFFAKTKKWAAKWWEDNEGNWAANTAQFKDHDTGSVKLNLEKYKEVAGVDPVTHVIIPPQYLSKDASDEDKEVLRCYHKTTKNMEDCGVVEDNIRVLLISDMHIPYHHPDTIEFLQYLKDKYNPTRVICMGDELDKHSLSFHDSDPDLPSAGDELRLALPVIRQLKEMFPVMDVLESNHGSLVYRKAHAHGIPRHYLKSYNDVLGVDDNWKWHYDMTIILPNGNKCYLHHGKSANITKTSQTMSMCAAAGHFHETFKVEYWGNPNGLYWAMQTGCLIDDKAYAFNYNNVNLKRPIIGTGLVINSLPVLEAMVLGKDGRWIHRKNI